MLKYGHYILTSGWGGEGIYKISAIVSVDKDGRDIIDPAGIVAGTGSGYEETIFDDEICRAMVEAINKK